MAEGDGKTNAYQRQAASWTSVERDLDMESTMESVDGASRSGLVIWVY